MCGAPDPVAVAVANAAADTVADTRPVSCADAEPHSCTDAGADTESHSGDRSMQRRCWLRMPRAISRKKACS